MPHQHGLTGPQSLHDSAAETASANGSITRKISHARTLEVWINVSAVSGTDPTLVVSVETSLDGTNFVAIGATSSITATGDHSIAFSRNDDTLGKHVRISWVIGGTDTPTFTFDAKMGAQE